MTDLDAELAELGVPPVTEAAAPAPAPKAALAVVNADTQTPPWALAWERWKPEFAKAMDGSFHTIDALESMIFKGAAQLWPGAKAAIVTQIVSYPGEKALQGLWAAGDLAEVRALIPGVEAYGRLLGCTSVLVEGQAGWVRALKDMGYAPLSVTVRKAL